MILRQIVGLGGGGFSEEPDNLQLDRYILGLSGKSKPKVCFLPTASRDADGYIRKFHWIFKKLTRGGQSHLTLYDTSRGTSKDPATHLLKQDVIYVGGGDTPAMLAKWRETGVDVILREAYERGVILAGISAGSLCWFESGVTDSASPGTLTPLACLGLLPGSNNVHYGDEPGRRSTFQKLIARGELPAGYGVDNGVGLHFLNGELYKVVSSRPDARAYRVEPRQGAPGVRETEIVPQYLGGPGAVVRRASVVDAPGIRRAHHASIVGIASRDYSPEQIAAWSARALDAATTEQTRQQIISDRIWVLEIDGTVEGFAHLRTPHDLAPAAYMHALYLSPAATGQGLARRLVGLVELEARQAGYPRLLLHASKTAIGFYAKLGYEQAGPPQLHQVGGVGIECLPMGKSLPPV